MVSALRRSAFFFGALIAVAGCDISKCHVRDDVQETVTVTDSPHSTYFSLCVESGDCQRLCVDAAMARSTPYHSAVDSCERVESDGGIDAGSTGGDPQVTLQIHYRVYEFCGA
jgi:hypothetical protein